MKKILVVSRGLFHPDLISRIRLRRILLSIDDGQKYEFTSSLGDIDGIDSACYHAVVLFFHEKDISESGVNALEAFVKDGGNLFCLHGALASFKNYPDYTELTGGIFTGHDKVKDIHITGESSFIIKDELYEFKLKDDCTVRLDSGGLPVFWTRNEGKGRVFCLSPGHKPSTFCNEDFSRIVKLIVKECLKAGNVDEKD